MLGAIFSKKDFRDYRLICKAPKTYLPDEFQLDFFEKYKAKSQGAVSSCVAHALSEILEYYDYIQNGNNYIMSTGYIYGNRNTSIIKSEGMVIRDALNVVKLYGDVYEHEFPYNIEVPEAIQYFKRKERELYEKGCLNHIGTYCKLKREDDIKFSLIEGKPVIVAIEWYSDIRVIDGILKSSKQGSRGGHCMIIYGWNKQGWKVLNSNGRYWGMDGKCILPYDYKLKEVWSIIDTTEKTHLDIKKPFTSKAGMHIATILNSIWDFFQ